MHCKHSKKASESVTIFPYTQKTPKPTIPQNNPHPSHTTILSFRNDLVLIDYHFTMKAPFRDTLLLCEKLHIS